LETPYIVDQTATIMSRSSEVDIRPDQCSAINLSGTHCGFHGGYKYKGKLYCKRHYNYRQAHEDGKHFKEGDKRLVSKEDKSPNTKDVLVDEGRHDNDDLKEDDTNNEGSKKNNGSTSRKDDDLESIDTNDTDDDSDDDDEVKESSNKKKPRCNCIDEDGEECGSEKEPIYIEGDQMCCEMHYFARNRIVELLGGEDDESASTLRLIKRAAKKGKVERKAIDQYKMYVAEIKKIARTVLSPNMQELKIDE